MNSGLPSHPSSLRVYLRYWLRRLIPRVDLERRAEVQVQLREDARPDFDFFLLVVLSCIIATLGLLVDSPATIIGAMLVAPLMSPIIGLGLASITGDSRLLQDSITALFRGAILAVLISFLLTLVNSHLPFVLIQPDQLPSEVIARTRPSPIDLGIALAGGLAAAFALSMPHISAALPGVAIATALMPPLCTIGVALALGDWGKAGGALLLFVTNAVTIAFAASLVFFTIGFNPRSKENLRSIPRSLQISAGLTLAILIPLSLVSIQFVKHASIDRTIHQIVDHKVHQLADSELISWKSIISTDSIKLEITLRTTTPLLYDDSVELQREIAESLQEANILKENQRVEVVVIQFLSARLDPLIPPTLTHTPTVTHTFTPGPSPTATHSATPSPTATTTHLPSNTPSATPTETATATYTRTPIAAVITGYIIPGMQLRQWPEGPIIATLRQDKPITLLYGSQVINGLVWVEVQDHEGRIGWIPQIYLLTSTPNPTPTDHSGTDNLAPTLSITGSHTTPIP